MLCRLPRLVKTLIKFTSMTVVVLVVFELGRMSENGFDVDVFVQTRINVNNTARPKTSSSSWTSPPSDIGAKRDQPNTGSDKISPESKPVVVDKTDDVATRSTKEEIVYKVRDDYWNGRHDDEIPINTSRPVVNPHPYDRILDNPNICGPDHGANIFLLAYVHTAVDHFRQRNRIRRLWGNQENYPNVTVRTVFFLGLTTKAAWLQDALVYESKKYGDIVQENFTDTYWNLSYKGIAALRWITTNCHQAKYIMKTDDDMFVNLFALIKHLTDIYQAGYRRRLMMCYVWWRMHVLREGQWGIPVEVMPDSLYPVYCSGMGYVFTTDVAVAMYRVSYYERFFWVDDVYISGILPRGLGGAVNHTEMSAAYCGVNELAVYWHPTEWYKYAFSHVHDWELYEQTWRNLTIVAKTNTIPTPEVIKPGRLAASYIPKPVLFPEQWEKKREQRQKDREKKQEKAKRDKEKKKKDAAAAEADARLEKRRDDSLTNNEQNNENR